MPTILLSGRKFSYRINHQPTKTFSLRLNSRRSFTVRCHFLTPDFLINNFIRQHSPWIINRSAKFPSIPLLKNLQKLTILDHDYRLTITKSSRDSVVIFDDLQQIYLNSTSLSSSHLNSLLDKKMRPFALKIIKTTLSELKSVFGFKYGSVTVRNQTSRFGSCSSLGNLNFNWQIIFFPADKFRHLLLHELTHLEIKNHSSKFWARLSTYDPSSRQNNLWLRHEGPKHFLIKIM